MKQAVLALGVVLLFAGSLSAQAISGNPSYFTPSAMPPADDAATVSSSLTYAPALSASTTTAFATDTTTFAPDTTKAAPNTTMAFSPSTAMVFAPSAPWANVSLLNASSDPAGAPQQPVQGVFQNFNWQAYIGYTYVRFFQTPGVTLNTNGFNFGVVYYFKDWIGADGEFVATFGSQFNQTAKFLLGMGGVRLRWSAPRGIEVWAHGMVGGSHYLPQTANGNQGALAYELGGGVDIAAGRRRWAYRLEADAVGTRYFSTYQYSPKVSAGIVFKF